MDCEKRRCIEFGVVVALSLFGLCFIAGLAWRLRSPAAPAARAEAPVFEPPPPSAVHEAAPGSRLYVAEDAPGLSFTRIMDILGAQAAKPEAAAAKIFVKEFMAKPELKETYEEFKESAARGEQPTAVSFLRALRDIPSFRALTARFGGSGGQPVVMAISNNPDIKRFLNRENEQRVVSVGGAPKAMRRAAQRRGPVSAFAPAAGERPAAVSAPGGARSFSASASNSGAMAPAGAPGATGARRQDAVAAGTTGPGAAAGGAKTSSQGIDTKLGTIADAKSERMKKLLERYPWLKALGEDLVRQLIEGNLIDQWGLWGACLSLGVYGNCRDACQAGGCTPMSGWDACMDWQSSDLPCIRECGKQAPACSIPAPKWQQYCVARTGSHGEALAKPPPYPECSGGGDTSPPCKGEGCTPEGIRCWSKGIGLPDCVGQQFCGERGHLPASLPELVDWGNGTGRRNTSTKVWTCR